MILWTCSWSRMMKPRMFDLDRELGRRDVARHGVEKAEQALEARTALREDDLVDLLVEQDDETEDVEPLHDGRGGPQPLPLGLPERPTAEQDHGEETGHGQEMADRTPLRQPPPNIARPRAGP